MRYRTKPRIVEAYQMLDKPYIELDEDGKPVGDIQLPEAWPSWAKHAWAIGRLKPNQRGAERYELCRVVTTLHGTLSIIKGSFLIKAAENDFEVMRSELFKERYEAIGDEPAAEDAA